MSANNIEELLSILIQAVLVPAIPLITVLIGVLVNKAIKYIQEKSDNEYVDRYAQIIGDELMKAVKATNQTFVSEIKKNNGTLTKEEQLKAFQMSKEAFEKSIGNSGIEFLQTVHGDYEHWLQQTIDSIVNDNHLDFKKTAE